MLPVLQIGPLSIQTPGLAILLALWFGLSLTERHAPRYNQRADILNNLVFVVFISGLLGGRLVYVLQYLEAFFKSPASLVSLNPGLFDMFGGLAIGALAGLIYAQRKRLSLWPTLDALTHLLAVLAIGVAVSHLASGEAFGKPSDLPWAIELWGTRRHPSQIYEVLGSLLILGLVWPRRTASIPGTTCLRFIALTAGLRLFLEAFRGDSTLIFSSLRLTQLIAWFVLAFSLALLLAKERRSSSKPPQQTL